MNIVCISASNVEKARLNSASTRACQLIEEIACQELAFRPSVEIVPLLDYELTPCRMCGGCFQIERCIRDEDFNQVFEKMTAADAVFCVIPHYAPFPSKVMMLLEKLQEMVYLKSCADPNYRFPLYRKPLGLIAHGGQTEEEQTLDYYRKALLEPLSMSFRSVQMRVIGAGGDAPHGLVFGIRSLALPAGSLFVTIEHDWDGLRERFTPLVRNVLSSVEAAAG